MNHYLWVKAFHIISVISWMAGMLYLPRLFVYHVDAKPGGELSETLKVMERKLMRIIINPAMILTFGFGLWLVKIDGWEELGHAGWFHVKVAFVVLLLIMHMMFARWRRDFANDRNVHSAKFYRMINEAPAVCMIVIVLMAIVKPF